MKYFYVLAVIFGLGLEVYLLNIPELDSTLTESHIFKISMYFIQSVLHGGILFFILKFFSNPKKDSLKIKLSFIFCLVLLVLGGFRVLISFYKVSNYETWVASITTFYHMLRSPNVFAIIIPLFIVLRKPIDA
ncbi:MAG: hypothetical protein ACPG6V_04590 [Flavobacteriales bacterium]